MHAAAAAGSFSAQREIEEEADRLMKESAVPRRGTQPVMEPVTKPTNPKDIVGSDKLPLHLVPDTMMVMASIAFLNGGLKYGRSNWRNAGVRASIYKDAAMRHIMAWFEGEEVDEEGVPHLSSALACLGIIVDARAAGKLNDDRNFAGGYRRLATELTPHVARLKALHAGRDPKHYTIQDSRLDDELRQETFAPLDTLGLEGAR
jgi:hypothetical protein